MIGRPLQEGFEQRDFNEALTTFVFFYRKVVRTGACPRTIILIANEGKQSAGQNNGAEQSSLAVLARFEFATRVSDKLKLRQ